MNGLGDRRDNLDNMPITINNLLNKVGIVLTGRNKWGESINSNTKGVYLVSLSDDPGENNGTLKEAPISIGKIEEWLKYAKNIELFNQEKPSAEDIKKHLSEYWLPHENILYIGKTTNTLRKRVNQFYNTKIWKGSPHHGGYWIKTLDNLDELWIYYAECEEPEKAESLLLAHFIKEVVLKNEKGGYVLLPFGNLRFDKYHGLEKETE